MFRKIKFLAFGMATLLTSVASATEYHPLVRCAGGAVVFDRIVEDSGFTHYQLVTHGRQLTSNVMNLIRDLYGSAKIYNDGATGVYDVRHYRPNAQAPSGMFRRVPNSVYTSRDTLTVHGGQYYEGTDRTGEYIFYGCAQVNN